MDMIGGVDNTDLLMTQQYVRQSNQIDIDTFKFGLIQS